LGIVSGKPAHHRHERCKEATADVPHGISPDGSSQHFDSTSQESVAGGFGAKVVLGSHDFISADRTIRITKGDHRISIPHLPASDDSPTFAGVAVVEERVQERGSVRPQRNALFRYERTKACHFRLPRAVVGNQNGKVRGKNGHQFFEKGSKAGGVTKVRNDEQRSAHKRIQSLAKSGSFAAITGHRG
jgi:hypothetical protein